VQETECGAKRIFGWEDVPVDKERGSTVGLRRQSHAKGGGWRAKVCCLFESEDLDGLH